MIYRGVDEPSIGIRMGRFYVVAWYGPMKYWWFGHGGSTQNEAWTYGLGPISIGWALP
jgi:hypothetical protein